MKTIESVQELVAYDPFKLYTISLGVTVVRNLVLYALSKVILKDKKKKIYCQQHSWASPLLKWQQGKRQPLSIIDFVVQVAVVEVLHRRGITPSAGVSFRHAHMVYESSLWNYCNMKLPYVGRAMSVLSSYIPISWPVTAEVLSSSNPRDFYVSQIPMLTMSLNTELVGLAYRWIITPDAPKKRTLFQDIIRAALQWSITNVGAMWLAVRTSRLHCYAFKVPFNTSVTHKYHIWWALIGNVMVELIYTLGTAAIESLLMQRHAAQVPEGPAPVNDGGNDMSLERQSSVDVTQLPQEQVEELENLEQQFGQLDTPRLNEMIGACERFMQRTDVKNSGKVQAIITQHHLHEYGTAVNLGYLRRGLRNEVIPSVLKKIDSPSESCTICLGPVSVDEGCKLFCEHIFHKSCIEEWLSRKKRCPMCRREAEGEMSPEAMQDLSEQVIAFGQQVDNMLEGAEGLVPPDVEYASWIELCQYLREERDLHLNLIAADYEPNYSVKDCFGVLALFIMGLSPPDFGGE
eukprot:PhF_6_TR6069/c0_g1_i1/m.8810